MSNADFAAALSTTALTEAERLRLIAGRQLTDAELEKALATNIASNANVGATATTFSLTNAFNKLGLSIRGVGAAAMSNPITAIITVALTAITVISQVKSHIEQAAAEAEQKAEEAAGAIQQINETFKKTSETTEQIGERFAELSQGVDSFTGKNKSLTTDEYAEFLNLSNQLAEMFPTLTRNYDENGNAIVNLSGDVDTIVGSLKNLVEVQREVANQEIVNNLPNLYEGAIKKSREYRIESQTYQEEIDDTISAWEGINGGFVNGNMMSIRAPVNSLEELEKVEQVYLSVLDDLGIVYQYADNIDGIRYKINSFSDMNEKEIEDTKAKIENGVKEALLSDTTLNKYFDDSYKKIEEQYGRIIDLNTNKSKAVWNNVTQSIYAWLQTDSTFQVLDDNLQTAIQKMISGVDFSELNNGKGFDNWDELSNYIVTNVIDPIAQATPEAQEALRGLFDVDFATATLKDYLTKIKPYLASIAQALGKTEEEVVTLFGLNDEITDFESMSAKREEILDSISERKDEYQKWLDGLSQSDFEIVYTLWLEGKVVNDVNSAKKELDKYKLKNTVPLEAFNTLLTDKGTAKDPHFIDEVDSYIEKTNKLNSAFEKFSKGDFDNEDFDKLIREFPQLATRSDDLGIAINELKEQMNSGISDRFAEELGKMPTKEDKDALLAWQQAILNVGKTTNEVVAQLSVDNNKTQQIIKGIDTAQKILSAQKSGQSISVEEFNSDEFKDYRSALEYVNGALHINEKKVREITKTKAKEYIETNKVNKANAQSKYIQNARQIALYRAQIEKGTYEKQYEIDTIKESIDNLLEENKTIAESCNQYDLLSASLQEATDSYEHWLNAQNATDYGDMMSDAESAIKLISDTFNENSDIYGQVGSKKYQAALELIIPDSIDSNNATAVKQYVDKLKKYFYFDENEAFAGMDIQKFISDSLNAGLMVFDQKSNEYKIAGGKTMEDFAEGLKLSSGMVQAFFDEMQLFGGKFDWSDEAIKTLGDLAIEANEAYEELRKIKTFKNLDVKLDYSDIADTDDQVKAIEKNLNKLNVYKSKLSVDSTEYQQTIAIMQYLFRQKQALEAPAVMNIDVSQVNEKYKEAITLLQDYQKALEDKAALEYFNMDTSSVDKELSETKQKLANLDPALKKKLKITTNTDEAIKESIKKFDTTNYQKSVKFVADTEEVEEKSKEISEPIDREVHYYATGVGLLPDSHALGRIEREVHYYKTGDIDLNGTAHASGTAKVGGDWGTAKGGKTLVGELGRKYFASVYSDIYYKFI